MKILQINAVYGDGSTGTIVKDIHEMCLSQGIESHVAYSTSSYGKKNIVNGYQIGKLFGKKVHALLCRVNGRQAYFSRFATKRLLNYIDELKPDIVHLHNLHSNYLHLNRLLEHLACRNISTVLTLHDCWFYTGGCFHYTEAGCRKWLEACGNCPKKRGDTPAYLADRSAQILQDRKRSFAQLPSLTVVGVSKWISSEVKQTFLGNADVRTIYNGVDLAFFRNTPSDIRKQLGVREDQFMVLGMANKWLLPVNAEALQYMAEHLPENAVMVIVGCTDQTLLPEGVIGTGYIKSREMLRKVYSAADVFLNCTYEESLSLVNVEAQACGTPIITYRNTGAQETVDEEGSFTVATGDYRAMWEKLLEIKAMGAETAGGMCREFVQKKFVRETNYQKYIALYSEIYDGKSQTKTINSRR